MKNLYARINLKTGLSQFYRCGILFGLAWVLVEVDDATASRLKSEQMLEISETEPANFELIVNFAEGKADADAEAAEAAEAAPAEAAPAKTGKAKAK